jgi:glycerol-3-phosphate dehydrogenase
VKHAFAGIRPLPYSPDHRPSAVTRRHLVHDHADDGAAHMLSVIGGKLTTAASLARDVARKIGLSAEDPNTLAMGPGAALDPLLDDAVLKIARMGGVSEETATGMVEWHGRRAPRHRPHGYGQRGVAGADLSAYLTRHCRGSGSVSQRMRRNLG